MNPITVRQMDFNFSEGLDPVVVVGDPGLSYGIIGLSLLLPHLEPYLIRSMKAARKHVTDPRLLDALARFSAQEGQHYRQHIKLNQAIRLQHFPKLAELESELAADYQRFTRSRSLRFNLAYAEGFEALTTASARFSFETRQGEKMHPQVADLFLWHLIEELEHRTVAFDVYEHVCGRYAYRLIAGLYAQLHMARFIVRVTKYMIEADPETVARHGGREMQKRRNREQLALARRHLLPKVLRTYLPGYTPHDIDFTEEMSGLAKMYSARAVHTS
jgi:predicted metal-dependent hydrolase